MQQAVPAMGAIALTIAFVTLAVYPSGLLHAKSVVDRQGNLWFRNRVGKAACVRWYYFSCQRRKRRCQQQRGRRFSCRKWVGAKKTARLERAKRWRGCKVKVVWCPAPYCPDAKTGKTCVRVR